MKKFSTKSLKSLLLLFVFLLAACGLKTQGVKVSYPNRVTPEMQAEFDLIEKDFEAQRYKKSQAAYQAYLDRYPYNALSDVAQFRMGQIFMLKPQYDQAIETFDALVRKTPDPAVASRARVKAGISQYRLNKPREALGYFDQTQAEHLQDHDRVKMGALALRGINFLNISAERKGYYLALLIDSYGAEGASSLKKKYGEEAPSAQTVQESLNNWAKAPAALGEIDKRLLTYKAQKSEPYVQYKLGMAFYSANNMKSAKAYLNSLVSKYPTSDLAMAAKPILDKIGYQVAKENKPKGGKVQRIGVILPLSGKYQIYGANTLKGMECAASAKPGCEGLSNIELVVRDDKGEAEAAVQAVEDLVNNEKVSAIIGPLSSTSAMAAAQKANELQVVMLSLAQKDGIAEMGDSIFRFSLTPEEQVRALLTYAAGQKNTKQFGVFYPNNNYGKVFFSQFQEMAPQFGATVTASQAFSPKSSPDIELRQLKFSVAKASMQNPLGFDALFIPDSYASVLRSLPALKNLGMDKLLFLGTNAWNDPALAAKSSGLLNNSVFLDIYFKNADSPVAQEFVRQYQAAYAQEPSTLEAMGYDAVKFLGQALAGQKPKSAQDVARAMLAVQGFQGVTGLRAFQSSREAKVDPYLLTVVGDKISEVKK